MLGRRKVRTAAQVLPHWCAIAPQVVINRQLFSANFDGRFIVAALKSYEFTFIWFSSKFSESFCFGDYAAAEALTGLDDFAHRRFELFKIFGRKGFRRIEVVIETIGDWRSDAELGLGEYLLYGLS